MMFLAVVVFLVIFSRCPAFVFFFFNDTATTEIYTLSLHDALPISRWTSGTNRSPHAAYAVISSAGDTLALVRVDQTTGRSEEHTSELQSQSNLVCRLLLEKKKKKQVGNSAARTYLIYGGGEEQRDG